MKFLDVPKSTSKSFLFNNLFLILPTIMQNLIKIANHIGLFFVLIEQFYIFLNYFFSEQAIETDTFFPKHTRVTASQESDAFPRQPLVLTQTPPTELELKSSRASQVKQNILTEEFLLTSDSEQSVSSYSGKARRKRKKDSDFLGTKSSSVVLLPPSAFFVSTPRTDEASRNSSDYEASASESQRSRKDTSFGSSTLRAEDERNTSGSTSDSLLPSNNTFLPIPQSGVLKNVVPLEKVNENTKDTHEEILYIRNQLKVYHELKQKYK